MIITYDKYKGKQIKEGFSFIELIVAIAIIGILAVVAVPAVMRWLERAKETRTETTLNALKTSINAFQIDAGKFPTSLSDLVRKPADAKRWRGPYLEQTDLPEDGWGNPFIYKLNPKGAPHPYELYAESPTGEKYSVWEIGKR